MVTITTWLSKGPHRLQTPFSSHSHGDQYHPLERQLLAPRPWSVGLASPHSVLSDAGSPTPALGGYSEASQTPLWLRCWLMVSFAPWTVSKAKTLCSVSSLFCATPLRASTYTWAPSSGQNLLSGRIREQSFVLFSSQLSARSSLHLELIYVAPDIVDAQ